MTVIIGYKDKSGEAIIAADNRVTWGNVHADHLQKICIYPEGMAIAFASNDVLFVRRMLEKFACGLQTDCKKEPTLRNLLSRKRLLSRLLNQQKSRLPDKHRTDFLVLICGRPGERGSLLFHYMVTRSKVIEEALPPGKVIICGSIGGHSYREELARAVRSALTANPGQLNMVTRSALLDNAYHHAHQQWGHHWPSVGELIYTSYSSGGYIMWPDSETGIFGFGGNPVSVAVEYDPALSRYVQRNRVSGKSEPLIPLVCFSERNRPSRSNTFRIRHKIQ